LQQKGTYLAMQVLWAANLWEEGVPVKQHSYSFDDEHACPKKFPKVPGLRDVCLYCWPALIEAHVTFHPPLFRVGWDTVQRKRSNLK
jgi:hypothetical protein